MSKEKWILASCWTLGVVLLVTFIPKDKVRNGVIAFLYKQVVTWLFGLIVVEKRYIKYPFREFKHAYKGSFSFEYFLYPTLCAIFNIYYPESRGRLAKFFYINAQAGLVTVIEVFIEKYTSLIKYVKWNWYWSYLAMSITFYSSRLFYRWFFKAEISPDNIN